MNRFVTFYYQRVKPFFLHKPLFAEGSENPFFILSAGRSGSTLLRKLLLKTTSVNIPPESDDLIPKLIKFYLRYNHKSWEYIVKKCADLYNQEAAIAYWKAPLGEDKLQLLFSLKKEDRTLAAIIGFFYNNYAKEHSLSFEKWGDKTPFLIFRLAWINLLFPSAKFIFLIRDGRAVVNSFLTMNKGYSIESASARWLRAITAMEKQVKKAGKDRVLIIKYENLLKMPEAEIKKICNFLHLTFLSEPKKELFLGDDILPHHVNVNSEINTDYINKWKKDLNEEEVKKIMNITGSKQRELGYD